MSFTKGEVYQCPDVVVVPIKFRTVFSIFKRTIGAGQE
jgi:hypothetical protein